MGKEIFLSGANTSDSKELTVWDAVFASLRVGRIISQIVVRISGFTVKVCL